jgi:hypothetical protein
MDLSLQEVKDSSTRLKIITFCPREEVLFCSRERWFVPKRYLSKKTFAEKSLC